MPRLLARLPRPVQVAVIVAVAFCALLLIVGIVNYLDVLTTR